MKRELTQILAEKAIETIKMETSNDKDIRRALNRAYRIICNKIKFRVIRMPIAVKVSPVRVGIEPSNWNSIFTVIVTTTSDFCRG